MVFTVTKTIDNIGRIVLPKSMREYYGIEANSTLIMIPTEGGILIKKQESSPSFEASDAEATELFYEPDSEA